MCFTVFCFKHAALAYLEDPPHENRLAKVTHRAESLKLSGYCRAALTFNLPLDSEIAMSLEKNKSKTPPKLVPELCIIKRNVMYSFNNYRSLRP